VGTGKRETVEPGIKEAGKKVLKKGKGVIGKKRQKLKQRRKRQYKKI
jgi:hypothetical protein